MLKVYHVLAFMRRVIFMGTLSQGWCIWTAYVCMYSMCAICLIIPLQSASLSQTCLVWPAAPHRLHTQHKPEETVDSLHYITARSHSKFQTAINQDIGSLMLTDVYVCDVCVISRPNQDKHEANVPTALQLRHRQSQGPTGTRVQSWPRPSPNPSLSQPPTHRLSISPILTAHSTGKKPPPPHPTKEK